MSQSSTATRAHEDVQFGDRLNGVLYLPDGTARTPAVLVFHERYGLVEHTRRLAARLAGDGCVAFAPDLFARWEGDKEKRSRGEVWAIVPDEDVASIASAALDHLKEHPRVDSR